MNQYQLRIQELQREMEVCGLHYYLVQTADPHQSEYIDKHYKAREYLTGFTGSNGTLLVTRTEAIMWTDGRYDVQAKLELEGSQIILYITNQEKTVTLPDYLKKSLHEGEIIGFDGRIVSAYFGNMLQKLAKKLQGEVNGTFDLVSLIWKNRPNIEFQELFCLPKEHIEDTCKEKCALIRKNMQEKACSYFVLSKLDDIMWLLNIRGRDVPHNLVGYAHIVMNQETIILYSRRSKHTEKFQVYCDEQEIICREYEEFEEAIACLEIKEGLVWIDPKSTTFTILHYLNSKNQLYQKTNPTLLPKSLKSNTEIKYLKETYEKDSVVMTKFLYWMKHILPMKEVTEYTAGMYLDNLRREVEGFIDYSFDTICAYGEQAAMMHYMADATSCKVVKQEGMLLVDSGAHYYGGTTDVTRTIVLGELTKEQKKHYTLVVAGMLRLQNAVFIKGCTGRNLDILARNLLWKELLDYKCGTGHGVGYMLNVHEGPQGIRYQYNQGEEETVFLPGMVTSNEPGVYLEGAYGIRIENIMVCKECAEQRNDTFLCFEPLTLVPIDLDGIDVTYMAEEDRKNINEYHKMVYKKISIHLEDKELEWLKEVTREI
ncbi:MAG: aminopeptidase P family protein [Eubacteriales bacterium]